MIRGPLGRGGGGRHRLEGHRLRRNLSLKFWVKRWLKWYWGWGPKWRVCGQGWCLFSWIKIALFTMWGGRISCRTGCLENTRRWCIVWVEQGHPWQRWCWGARGSSWHILQCMWLRRQPWASLSVHGVRWGLHWWRVAVGYRWKTTCRHRGRSSNKSKRICHGLSSRRHRGSSCCCMLERPGPAEHVGPRGRRARGSWRSSPRRGLHGCRANRSEDQVTLVDVTEETEVRQRWVEKKGKREWLTRSYTCLWWS